MVEAASFVERQSEIDTLGEVLVKKLTCLNYHSNGHS